MKHNSNARHDAKLVLCRVLQEFKLWTNLEQREMAARNERPRGVFLSFHYRGCRALEQSKASVVRAFEFKYTMFILCIKVTDVQLPILNG